jgi:hypothetical protein
MVVAASIENLAAIDYHRIGSDVYWQFNNLYRRQYSNACADFSNTILDGYIEKISFSEAMHRFATHCCKIHGSLFGEEIKYISKRDTEDSTRWYISFYTGKIDSKGKAKSNYFEVARVVAVCDEDDCSVSILDKVHDWLVQSSSEAMEIFDNCFLIQESNLMKFCARLCNDLGYRYNEHGGHYFISHAWTDKLYELKKRLENFNLYLAIKPVIAGSEEDIEPILRLIGEDFREIIESSEKRLFEMCLLILSKEQEWLQFYAACMSKSDYQNTYIAKTRYGKQLCDKVARLIENSSKHEYDKLIKELLDKVAPDERASYKKILQVRNDLQRALDKLRECNEISPLVQKHYDKVVQNLVDVNKTVQFVSKHIRNEILTLEF